MVKNGTQLIFHYLKSKKMKKLLIVCLAFISGTAVSAQQGNRDRDYSYHATGNAAVNKNYGAGYAADRHYSKYERGNSDYPYAPANRRNNDYRQRDSRYGNHRYDKDCGNNSRIPQRGRPQNTGSLGKGIVIGAAAGIILGAVLSH